MEREPRSHCPIAFALDLFGDKWTLLVLRDLLLRGKRQYSEFLASEEAMATNILSERLRRLEREGLATKSRTRGAGRQYVYRPTRKALDLLPVLLEISCWSAKYDPMTAAPPALMRRIKRDREGVIREIRRQFRSNPGKSPPRRGRGINPRGKLGKSFPGKP